jgi:hypothetical protein
VVAEHAFASGIYEGEAAVEADGDDGGAGGVEELAEWVGGEDVELQRIGGRGDQAKGEYADSGAGG